MTNYNISEEAMTLLTEAGGKLEGEWMKGFWDRSTFAKLAGGEYVSGGKYASGYWRFPVSGENSGITEITSFEVNVVTGEVKLKDAVAGQQPSLYFREYWYEELLPALVELCKVEKVEEKEEATKVEEAKKVEGKKVSDGVPALSITVSDCSKTRRSIGRVYQAPGSGFPQKMRYAKASEAIKQKKLFPSITNVISSKAIDLTGWAKYMMRKSIMEQWKDFNGNNLSEILSKAQKANDEYTELACDKGSEVHLACENNILHGKKEHDFKFGGAPYYEGFLKFCEDFQPRFISVETTVFGTTDDENLPYAGTIDFIAEINGKIIAGDWKTSKVLHEEVGMQLSAGIHASKMVGEDGQYLEDMIEVDKAIGVHLTENGYSVSEIANLDYCWSRFQALRKVWEWNAFGGNFYEEQLKPVTSPDQL